MCIFPPPQNTFSLYHQKSCTSFSIYINFFTISRNTLLISDEMRQLFGPDLSSDESEKDEHDSQRSGNSSRSTDTFSPRRDSYRSQRGTSPFSRRPGKRNREGTEDTSLASRSVTMEGEFQKIYINEKNVAKIQPHTHQGPRKSPKKRCCNRNN